MLGKDKSSWCGLKLVMTALREISLEVDMESNIPPIRLLIGMVPVALMSSGLLILFLEELRVGLLIV